MTWPRGCGRHCRRRCGADRQGTAAAAVHLGGWDEFIESGCRGEGFPGRRLHRRDGRSRQQSPRVRRSGTPPSVVGRHAAEVRARRCSPPVAVLGQWERMWAAWWSGAQVGRFLFARGAQDLCRTTAAIVVVGHPGRISAPRVRRRGRDRGRSRAPTTHRVRWSPRATVVGRCRAARFHSRGRRWSLGCPEVVADRRQAESAHCCTTDGAGHVRHPDTGGGIRRRQASARRGGFGEAGWRGGVCLRGRGCSRRCGIEQGWAGWRGSHPASAGHPR